MRLLVLTHEIPYPMDNGIRIKIGNMLKALSPRHECDIITTDFCDGKARAEKFRKELPDCKIIGMAADISEKQKKLNRIKAMLSGKPAPMYSYYNKELAKIIKENIKDRYDAVIVCNPSIAATCYKINIPHPTVFAFDDSMTRRYEYFYKAAEGFIKRLYLKTAKKAFRRFEKNLCNKFDVLQLISNEDAEYIKKLNPQNNTCVIPLEIEDKYFSVELSSEDNTVFLSGAISDPAITKGFENFVKITYPAIKEKVPDIRFNVLGGKNIPENIDALCKNTSISLVGQVDVQEYIEWGKTGKIAVFVDYAGTGMKNRVGQAFAMGQAVVATQNALDGYAYTQGVNAVCENDYALMADRIVELIKNKEACDKLGKNGKLLAEKNHSHGVIKEKWLTLLDRIVKKEEK